MSLKMSYWPRVVKTYGTSSQRNGQVGIILRDCTEKFLARPRRNSNIINIWSDCSGEGAQAYRTSEHSYLLLPEYSGGIYFCTFFH